MRRLSPYEQNHLRRHGIDPESIGRYGEMPVEYITGIATIRGRDFVVDRRVLIPRVEEEDLIELALKEVSERQATSFRPELRSSTPRLRLEEPRGDKRQVFRFADVGTGCGCLGITLYKELSAYRPSVMSSGLRLRDRSDSRRSNDFPLTAYLSDISKDALDVARMNIDRLVPKPHHIHLLQSDLFLNYKRTNDELANNFDLIVANLPYIPSGRIASFPSSVRDYEPRLALDGRADGLTLINKFLTQALQYLDKDGFIVIEVDESHRTEQLKQLEQGSDLPERSDPSYSIVIHKDQFGKDRFWLVRRI